jgi:hypothetical protein
MNEDEVKKRTEHWLISQGAKVKREVAVAENRELIMDFFAYCDGSRLPMSCQSLHAAFNPFIHSTSNPVILWVECKGDHNLSQLLEGFIRLELAIYLSGGLGILAAPHQACQKLLKYRKFLKQAENVIGLLDIEKGVLVKM